MICSNRSINGLQICIAAAVSIGLPSLSPVPTAEQEVLSACRAHQRSLLSLETLRDDTCVLDKGDTAWNPSNGVKIQVDTSSYVEGQSSTKFEVQAEFAGGSIAGIDTLNNTEATNVSDIECLTFWIKSSKQVDSDTLQLRLMDDTSVTSSLDIDIPEYFLDVGHWKKVSVVIPVDSNIGSYFDSVVLYALKDPGNLTIWLDIIEARTSSESQQANNPRLNELVLNYNEGTLTAG